MTSLNYSILLVFGVIVYIMIIDPNVNEYLTLVFKIIKVNIERVYWMIRLHPKNPITNLMMRWKYDRIARELQKEFNDSLRQTD
jgi:hypothetical protein